MRHTTTSHPLLWVAALLLGLGLGVCDANPILGVPLTAEDSGYSSTSADTDTPSESEFAHLVITTPAARVPAAADAVSLRQDDIVPLDSPKERSRFLMTLLMLESLREHPDKAGKMDKHVDPKLKSQLIADEEVMQDVLNLYETQQESKGRRYIKIPPKLMKKMKKKMRELLSE